MASLFRKKKVLGSTSNREPAGNDALISSRQRKCRSQSLDPTSLAHQSLAGHAAAITLKVTAPVTDASVPAATGSAVSKDGHQHAQRRQSSPLGGGGGRLLEGGLRQLRQLYAGRRGSKERAGRSAESSPTPSGGAAATLDDCCVGGQRPRSGSLVLPLVMGASRRAGIYDGRGSPLAAGGGGKHVLQVVKQRRQMREEMRDVGEVSARPSGDGAGMLEVRGGSGACSPPSPELICRSRRLSTGRVRSPASVAAACLAASLAPSTDRKSHSSISTSSVNAALYRRHEDPFRRRSLSGGDVSTDNANSRMAILFRDSRGLPVVDPFIDTLSNDLKDDEAQIYVKFFKFHKCYDLIPTSAKLVVFDTQLKVKKAFFALVHNGVRAAPLWDSRQQKFVGMLTITDFIRVLKTYYRSPNQTMDELEEHKLDTWRTVLESRTRPLVSIGPEESLFDAVSMLLRCKIHRLPVIDPVSGDVLYIITHKRILRFLHLYVSELPRASFLDCTLEQLQLGTYSNIETARFSTPVIETLNKFVERRVSALPILDDDDRLVHIYAKFDTINLAAEKIYNELHLPVRDVISHRTDNVVECCLITHTLNQVMEQIVRAEVHRLVVVDDDRHVIGIVSLSDILMALVLKPEEYSDRCHQLMMTAAAASAGVDGDSATTGATAGAGTECVGGECGASVDEQLHDDHVHVTIPEEEDGDEDYSVASASPPYRHSAAH